MSDFERRLVALERLVALLLREVAAQQRDADALRTSLADLRSTR